jgi:DNA polymerase V
MSLEAFGHQMRTRSLKIRVNRWRRYCPDQNAGEAGQLCGETVVSTGGVVDLSDRERQRKLLAKVPVECGA